jgi:phosphoribosylanthranilate isomerase
MPTRVKICGITRTEDAQVAVELGAAALGFNFYPPSPRYIAPSAARAIVERLPPLVMTVGVFVAETMDGQVASAARLAGVAALQIHGSGIAAANDAVAGYPLIRAVAVREGFRPEELSNLKANAFLLDTFDPVLRGGTGKTFDWRVARDAMVYGPIILAGGLTPENVGEAIRAVRPFAVDVASGVESASGIKDPGKLRAFFAAVEKADRTD